MKKKKLKNLTLNKINISRIDDVESVKGGTGGGTETTVPITIASYLVCSYLGLCDPAPAPAPAPTPGDPDNTRGCPSWNVAC